MRLIKFCYYCFANLVLSKTIPIKAVNLSVSLIHRRCLIPANQVPWFVQKLHAIFGNRFPKDYSVCSSIVIGAINSVVSLCFYLEDIFLDYLRFYCHSNGISKGACELFLFSFFVSFGLSSALRLWIRDRVCTVSKLKFEAIWQKSSNYFSFDNVKRICSLYVAYCYLFHATLW